jgi:hypothetical protein
MVRERRIALRVGLAASVIAIVAAIVQIYALVAVPSSTAPYVQELRRPESLTVAPEDQAPLPSVELPVPQSSGIPSPSSSATESSLEQVRAMQDAEVRTAVDHAWSAWIMGASHLSEEPVRRIHGGESLKVSLAEIQNMLANNRYLVARLLRSTIDSVEIRNRTAIVHATPRWELFYYSNDEKKCISHQPAYDLPQTLFLEHGETGWMVMAIRYDSEMKWNLQPCERGEGEF